MMNPADYAKVLSHSQIFNGIELVDLQSLVQMGKLLQPKPGSIVVEEGNRVPGLHVILEGSAQVVKSGQKLTQFGRGAFFGEISLFGVALGATASIVVGHDPSTLLLITSDSLQAWAKQHPEAERLFLRKMCVELSRRLYATSEKLSG
jgi:CRP-like cAMP-binding protein